MYLLLHDVCIKWGIFNDMYMYESGMCMFIFMWVCMCVLYLGESEKGLNEVCVLYLGEREGFVCVLV